MPFASVSERELEALGQGTVERRFGSGEMLF
jgi:hypothetical protein